nr:H-NS histone family protein [Paracoccus sp. FO-3]
MKKAVKAAKAEAPKAVEIDLDNMPLAELKALQKSVAKAIDGFEARRLAAARAELEARAKELGVTLQEVVGATGAKAGKPVAAKFRHPENPELTWSGRGRKPVWFAEALDSGKSEEDLLIA